MVYYVYLLVKLFGIRWHAINFCPHAVLRYASQRIQIIRIGYKSNS